MKPTSLVHVVTLIGALQLLRAAMLPQELATVSSIGRDHAGGSAYEVSALASVVMAASPTTTPNGIAAAQVALSSIFASSYAAAATRSAAATASTPLIVDALELIANGFTKNDLSEHVFEGTNPLSPLNSQANINLRPPRSVIYPQAATGDAPYSISEVQLRAAIHIPSSFKYGAGKAVPLLLLPGTGAYGGSTFESNMIKSFQGGDIADPVWLNVPGALLGDVQDTAEYVAYAINYVQSISNRQIAIASWSQGSVDAAWAFTYWPSTRSKVADVISYSGDYHGTTLAYLLCPASDQSQCVPSVLQQRYNSTLLQVLRAAGGASAYVPTTTIFSSFYDEIVQPQALGNASSFIDDSWRNVGVTNNEIQAICNGLPGGGFYTHEGVLYSPLAYYLTVDALTHDGPGRIERVGTDKACGGIVAPGISLADMLATEALVPVAGVNLLLYQDKLYSEPAIRSYANKTGW